MTTITATQTASLRPSALAATVVLAGFAAFTAWMVMAHGYAAFFALVHREPWALHMLVDLVIMLCLGIGWMRADAGRRGIRPWPYIVATALLGSLGVLAYCVRRGLASRPGR